MFFSAYFFCLFCTFNIPDLVYVCVCLDTQPGNIELKLYLLVKLKMKYQLKHVFKMILKTEYYLNIELFASCAFLLLNAAALPLLSNQ